MLDGFKRSEIKTKGARIVTVVGGSGQPLLLMHGNPFNYLSWHKVAPPLARDFTVVCTDLRGYGDSEKPPGGEDHSAYSFRAMAQDQVEVIAARGNPRHHSAASPAQSRQQAMGHVLLALVLQYSALRSARAHDGCGPRLVHRKEACEDQARFEFLRSGGARGVQALLSQSGNHSRHLRGLSRHVWHRSRDGYQGLRSRAQDRVSGSVAMGCDRRGRAQPQARSGRNMAQLRDQHYRRQGAALRTLSVGRGSERDHRSAARLFYRGLIRQSARAQLESSSSHTREGAGYCCSRQRGESEAESQTAGLRSEAGDKSRAGHHWSSCRRTLRAP